jgi:predicted ATPase/Tfp pilus assembly protein PilF
MKASSNYGLDRFVGRLRELAVLGEWVGRGERLVTVVGPPGMGKTRLVAEFLGQSSERRPDFARWYCLCDLSAVEDVRAIVPAIAHELALEAFEGRTKPETALGRSLSAKGRGLLVLDNVEHVADDLARSIVGWLEAAPELRVVATSRERLRVAEEACLELGPLSLPDEFGWAASDAVSLFVERARLQDPTFSMDAGDARIVAELVTVLDGIPLAIELAAARIGIMSADELRRRIALGIDVLSRASRSMSPRQATLRGAVQWSWDLLSPVEQDVLARCSVFRGSFRLNAAEEVLRGSHVGQTVLDLLHSLKDKSLVRVQRGSEGVRFELCFGVREFARERLVRSGMEEDAKARHARGYLALAVAAAAELDQSGRSELVYALARDREDLLAAYEHLDDSASDLEHVVGAIVALKPVLLSSGPIDQFLEMIERCLARCALESVPAAIHARVLHARARALHLSGSLEAAEHDFDAAMALLSADSDRWERAALLVDAGMLHHQRRSLDRARDHYTRALDLYEGGGAIRQQARVLGNIGAVHHDQREFDVASQYYRRALHLLRRAEEPRLEGNILANLGLLALEDGCCDEAEAYLSRAEAVLKCAADRRLLGIVRGNRGALALERGELQSARELLGLAIRDLAEFGDAASHALCLARHAAVEAVLSDANDWSTHSFAAERLIDADDDPLTHAAVRLYVALAELASVDPPSTEVLERVRARMDAARRPRPDSGSSLADLSDDVRAALRLLECRLARIEPLSESLRGVPEDSLVIGPEGTWFRPPRGLSQSLRSHGPVRRILLALSARACGDAREALSLDELREIGWPGEKIKAEAATNRVHVALAELRRRGLKALIVRVAKGYALSEGLTIHRSAAPLPEQR